MIIPVRCFTCGKVIGNKWKQYEHEVQSGNKTPAQIFDGIGFDRYCCRRMFVTHINLIDNVLLYTKDLATNEQQPKT
jgi:DNA-directed RNA polymerase subunit N